MKRLFARPAILISVVLLLTVFLGCANYGVLLRAQIVPPPVMDITLGPFDVRSWVDYDPPCGPHPYCQGGLEFRSTIFYISLFFHNPAAPHTSRRILFVRLPLGSP
jgi:hypothetical protein